MCKQKKNIKIKDDDSFCMTLYKQNEYKLKGKFIQERQLKLNSTQGQRAEECSVYKVGL